MRLVCLGLVIALALDIGASSAGAIETVSTGKFTFEFDDGYLPVARSFISATEDVADGVAGFLSVSDVNVSVRVYPQSSFEPGLPPFGVWATALGGNISVGLPPLPSAVSFGWTPERLRSVAAHELTHSLLPSAFPNASTGVPGGFPAWLEEGLGNYLASQYDPGIDVTARGIMRYLLDTSNVSTIDAMFLPVRFVTTQGYSLVQYLVQTSAAKFHRFLSNLSELPSCCDSYQVSDALAMAYGNDSTRMTAQWRAYLANEYAVGYVYPEVVFVALPLPDGTKAPGSWVGDLIGFSLETVAGVLACVSRPNGTGLRCAPGDASITADPRISPDGSRVLLTTNAAGHYDLALWTLANDSLILLTNDSFVDIAGSWSPDGQNVVVSSTRGGSFDVWRLTLSSGQLTSLTRDPSDEFSPAYSPDGAKLAWVSNRTGQYTTFLSDAAGLNPSPLWEGGPYLGFPAWSPDGTKVAATMVAAGYTGIAVVDVASSQRTVLVNLTTGPDRSGKGYSIGFPVFSPDGAGVAFSSLADIRIASTFSFGIPRDDDLVLRIGLPATILAGVVVLLVLAVHRRRKRIPALPDDDAPRTDAETGPSGHPPSTR